MKYISLWNPWARAMVPPYSLKKIETRGWSTNYRGPCAIHLAKHQSFRAENATLLDIAQDLEIDVLTRPPQHEEGSVAARLQGLFDGVTIDYRGAFIGVGDLVDVRPTSEWRQTIEPLEYNFGDYSDGRFGFLFVNVRCFAPIAFKARQGKLIDVPAEYEAKIRDQMERAAA